MNRYKNTAIHPYKIKTIIIILKLLLFHTAALIRKVNHFLQM